MQWTDDERDTFLRMFPVHGRDWPALHQHLPNRTEAQIRNFYQVRVRSLCVVTRYCKMGQRSHLNPCVFPTPRHHQQNYKKKLNLVALDPMNAEANADDEVAE